MQTQRTFVDDLKHQYKFGGMTIRLIFINVIVFLAIRILDVFFTLGGMSKGVFLFNYIDPIFGLHTKFETFATHPWALFTSIFTHYDFIHILLNMIFLYVSGRIFEQLFDEKRLLYTYLLGGISGGLLEVIAHSVFPTLGIFDDIVVGASGSIMAIFVAIAFYRPNMTVNIFGVLPVRIIIIALLFILQDLLSLGSADGTAHFAHLGGAILGLVSIQNLSSSNNIINLVQSFGSRIQNLFTKNRKLKIRKGSNARIKTDEEYNAESKVKQEEIDRILDKISKSGYESLSKKEKDFLFNQSKK